MTTQNAGRRDRRRFIGSLGAVAAEVATLGTQTQAHAAASHERERPTDAQRAGHFGRIFHGLPAFAEPTPSVIAALLDLGKPGGLLDARDDLTAGPVRLITDPALSINNPDNSSHTAGTTFVGQFLDHDMTFDVGSPLGRFSHLRRS